MCLDYQQNNDEDDINSLKLIQAGGALLYLFTTQNIEEQFECKLEQVYGIAEGLICMPPTNHYDCVEDKDNATAIANLIAH
ncbi:hypothetical protein SHJJP8921_001613 [Staphylococcus lugdunensis]|uniref:hypothetical protein n=1 Tax=Staphylococcus lugdunensis TaxID=28035 RepID=UPI001F4D26E8|nr:hypothetical protein [Staphylococcus lugdunensis]MCH8647341.1 hypothetical protein [Staphylococcus lugdunensis]